MFCKMESSWILKKAYNSSSVYLAQRSVHTRRDSHEEHIQSIAQIYNCAGTAIGRCDLRDSRQNSSGRDWSEKTAEGQKCHDDYFFGRWKAIINLIRDGDVRAVMLNWNIMC